MAKKSTRGRPKGSGIDDDKLLKKITNMLAKDPGLKPTSAIKAIGIDDPSAIRRLRDKLKSSGLKSSGLKSSGSRPSSTGRTKTKTVRKTAAAKKPAATLKSAARKKPRKKVATRKAVTASRAPKKSAVKKSAAKKSTAKKAAVKKTVTTRTASTGGAAPKAARPKKTVKTRRAPGKEAPDSSPSMGASMFTNPFAELSNGGAFAPQMQQMQMQVPDMDMENIISSTVEKQIQFYESALKFSPIAHMLRQQAMITDMMLTMLRTQKEITKPPRNK